jgi:hypothetical protein
LNVLSQLTVITNMVINIINKDINITKREDGKSCQNIFFLHILVSQSCFNKNHRKKTTADCQNL